MIDEIYNASSKFVKHFDIMCIIYDTFWIWLGLKLASLAMEELHGFKRPNTFSRGYDLHPEQWYCFLSSGHGEMQVATSGRTYFHHFSPLSVDLKDSKGGKNPNLFPTRNTLYIHA